MKRIVETDLDTGEVIEYYKNNPLKPFTQQNIFDKINNKSELASYIHENVGSYIMLFYERLLRLNTISNSNKMRFVYLCSNTDYNGYIIKKVGNKHVNLSRHEIRDLLNIKVRTANATLKELIDKKLLIELEDGIKVNKIYCKKGNLSKSDKNNNFSRVFEEYMKKVYMNTPVSNHGQLFYFFILLPHVHPDTNILCEDSSVSFESIRPLNMKDISLKVGYSVDKSNRLWTEINNLFVFDINKENGAFRSVFGKFDCKYGNQVIMVNPRLYYMGSKLEHFEFLDKLFNL